MEPEDRRFHFPQDKRRGGHPRNDKGIETGMMGIGDQGWSFLYGRFESASKPVGG